MKENMWIATIIAAAIVIATYIYVSHTRYVFSNTSSQGAVVYKMDRSTGQVWIIIGPKQKRVEE